MPSITIPHEVVEDIPLPSITFTINPLPGMCDLCGKKVWWFQKRMEDVVPDSEGKGTHHNIRHRRCYKRAELAAQQAYSRAVFERAMESIQIRFVPERKVKTEGIK